MDTLRLVALEEAVSVPELDRELPVDRIPPVLDREVGADWERRLADVEAYRLPDMDRAGIDVQVLSLTVPGIQVDLPADRAAAYARLANDEVAALVAAHPDRFAGFAALPLQDPAAAVAELHRAVEERGLVGALVNNCGPAFYLDHPRFDPLWTALERLRVPLYLHPGSPPADRWDVLDGFPELAGALWSWGAETGGHALRTVFGGVFDRHPGATLILGHLGEFLPFQRSRFDSRWRTLAASHRLDREPSAYLGTNVVFTTSGVFSPATLLGAVLEVGAQALLFAVDYPYESSDAAVAGLAATTLPDADRHAIAHGNAERLLRLPAR